MLTHELIKKWNKKLKKSGFVDIEDSKGRLKTHNTRTQAFTSMDATKEYYDLLDNYLSSNVVKLSRLERKILEFYSEGKKYDFIAESVFRSNSYVKKTILKHKRIFLLKK